MGGEGLLNKSLYGGGPPLNLLYTIFHNFVYLLLTNGTPFTYLAQNFVSVLTAGNPHCHKIGISHKYRTLSRRVRGWTSGRSLPVQIFVEYLSGISGGAPPYRPSQGVPSPQAQQEIITFPDKLDLHTCMKLFRRSRIYVACVQTSPLPQKKIGRRDVNRRR